MAIHAAVIKISTGSLLNRFMGVMAGNAGHAAIAGGKTGA
ncbi:hypothetical protein MGWOODY_Mmi2576 [hydrothermal vent metagenome]|uniref:Uncharacterized protein n=1 Tax=hydrothermal vent metagenome TaxID=652676 RepID=A0A160VHE4_9ZZZZ